MSIRTQFKKKKPYGGTENLSMWLKATESHGLWLNWDLNQALHPGISLDSMDSFPWLCNHKQLCPNLLLAYLLAGHT